MAHYDQATKDFMQGVSDKEEHKKEMLARQGVAFAKGLVRGGVKTLPTNVVKRAIGIASILTEPEIEKAAMPKLLALIETLNDKYSQDWHDWLPETLWQTIRHDFYEEPSDELKNTLQAVQVICKTNGPFEDWHIFEKVGHALNSSPVNFGLIHPLELDQAALTVRVMQEIRPKTDFEDEVLGYIAACAKEAGVVYLPGSIFPLGCNKFLDDMGNDIELKEKVERMWAHNLKHAQEGTNLEIQLARLREVDEYSQKV